MNREDRSDLVKYRLSKAKNTLSEVDILMENRLWNTAVNRLYYACYYAVIALLISHKIKATTHAGVRQMFGLHFIKVNIIDKELGKFFSEIYDLRQTGDYDDYIDFSEQDVRELIQPATSLINQIETILKKTF
ncbi:MAG: HEPN domain-containing protein [Prolixibacteraceae bacterium]|nr:HEPN domain-containing protein [Prolixibacteraceae bacterium]